MDSHECPLTGLVIVRQCPVTTCIWNCGARLKFGCMYGTSLPKNDRILSSVKGLSASDLEEQVEESKARIVSYLALDKYKQFIDSSVVATLTPLRSQLSGDDSALVGRVMERPNFQACSNWTEGKVLLAFSRKVWSRFAAGYPAGQGLDQKAVLGVKSATVNRLRRLFTTHCTGLTFR